MSPPSLGHFTPVGIERVPRHFGNVQQPRNSPAAPAANHHQLAADRARMLRQHRRLALALDRPRVLARLRMILARDERPEEAALGAASLPPHCGHRSFSSAERSCASRMSASDVDVVERLLRTARRSPSARCCQARSPSSTLSSSLFHLRREAHVEDVGELLHHHLLHALAERRREEAALLELDVVPVGERRDDAARTWTGGRCRAARAPSRGSPRRSAAAAR